jgi:aryl-alcohol dehydrogenase-like predicted oxidoreductase
VKFGALRGPNPGEFNGYDSRPAAVRNFVAYSLKRLGVDHIDLYRPARLDPNVPIEDTIGAIAELIKQGHVRYIGLSEVGSATIRRAQAVHPIADLQIEYSLISRGIEREILPTCRELSRTWTASARSVGGRNETPIPFDRRSGVPRRLGKSYAGTATGGRVSRPRLDRCSPGGPQVAVGTCNG